MCSYRGWLIKVLSIVVGLVYSGLVIGETPEEKGLRLTQEENAFNQGWQDFEAKLRLTLRNKQGEENVFTMRMLTKEVEGDGDKSIIVFDSPGDIRGTALLSHTHTLKADDQWLYLSAIKRIKRISSNNKSGPFLGSEFAYEDLTSPETEKYTYRWLKEEAIDGRLTDVIEQYPTYKYSGYKRLVKWLDKDYRQPVKVEFYDRKDRHLKTLTSSDFEQYLGVYWYPSMMFMDNHQTGKNTVLAWEDYVFRKGLTDRDFNRNALKRLR
ncbi:outer membrane lipoprotein-sorting protein [Eionea flava]